MQFTITQKRYFRQELARFTNNYSITMVKNGKDVGGIYINLKGKDLKNEDIEKIIKFVKNLSINK